MLTKMMKEFNDTYHVTPIKREDLKHTLTLIQEEVYELSQDILNEQSLQTIVKEMIDVIYVTAQQLSALGVDADVQLKAVHRSNMSKLVTKDHEKELEIAKMRYPNAVVVWDSVLQDSVTGKVIKPTTYNAADIVLANQKTSIDEMEEELEHVSLKLDQLKQFKQESMSLPQEDQDHINRQIEAMELYKSTLVLRLT